MKKHQVIYTSCMRGLVGINDGQQIYSFDKDFQEYKSEDVKNLFAYQTPSLEPGIIMNDEIAQNMPVSFQYRNIDQNKCAFALNSYIGKDYMGEHGRYGNYISHVMYCDKSDLNEYVCEYYLSNMFRRNLKFEESNNPNKPDYLTEPVFNKGCIIDIESVMNFISFENRSKILQSMFDCLLRFEIDQKRIIICDSNENNIFWISALLYLLPLKLSQNINYTTYEYDPNLSLSQICGVIKHGTRYKFSNDECSKHFLFDMYENYSHMTECEDNFSDFIEVSMTMSYESLKDFHMFLEDNFEYNKLNEDIYMAYSLYELYADGIKDIDFNRFKRAKIFNEKYGKMSEKLNFAKELLSQSTDILDFEIDYFIEIINVIFKFYDSLNYIEQDILFNTCIKRLLNLYSYNGVNENDFFKLLNEIDRNFKLCKKFMTNELMKEVNINYLIKIAFDKIEDWKLKFLVKLICNHIISLNLKIKDIQENKDLNRVFEGIFTHTNNEGKIRYLYMCVFEEFENFPVLTTDVMVLIGNYLKNSGKEVFAKLYYDFIDLRVTKSRSLEVIKHLALYNRIDIIHLIMKNSIIESTKDNCIKIFNEYYKAFIKNDSKYINNYFTSLIEEYFNKVKEFDFEDKFDIEYEILKILINHKMKTNIDEELIENLSILTTEPTNKEIDVINSISYYLNNINNTIKCTKFKIMYLGILLNSTSRSNKEYILNQIEIISFDRIKIKELDNKTITKYLNWIIPKIYINYYKSNEIKKLFDLFDINMEYQLIFINIYSKECISFTKDDIDYLKFEYFLEFVFEMKNDLFYDEIGKVLCNIKKNKIDLISESIKKHFNTDIYAINSWKKIEETAFKTNPIINGIKNIFKKS